MIKSKAFIPKLHHLPEAYHGKGSSSIIKYADRPVLLLASRTVKASSLYQQILKYLEGKGCHENSVEDCTAGLIRDISSEHMNKSVKSIIALGGGKVMDASKIIKCFLETGDFSFDKVNGYVRDECKKINLVCIPTTPGSGSHVSPVSVVKDEHHIKHPYVNPSLIPDTSVLDPSFIVGMNKPLLMEFVADIFSHAAESSVSRLSNPYIKKLGKSAMELLLEPMKDGEFDTGDFKAMENILFAGHLAGIAQSNAYVGCCHALAHYIEGRLRISHGKALLGIVKNCLLWHKAKLNLSEYGYYLEVYEKLGLGNYIDVNLIKEMKNIDADAWAKAALEDPSIKTNPLAMRAENLIEAIKWMNSN